MNKKTVLVTGASRGIGKAIAFAFINAGYHVFLNCNHSITELERVRDEIMTLPDASCDMIIGDVGNPEDVKDMFRRIYKQTDSLDVLVNNAGIAYNGLLSEMSDKDWNRIIQTNLSSVFYCCRCAVPNMVYKKSGRIINISSMWGTAGASCEAAYSATKAGVHGLTKSLAKELAPSNIPVNAIACGCIETSMNAHLSDEERLTLNLEIPMGRFGTPEEVAEAVLQLANAPDYLTGQIIGVDGGFL